MKLVVKIVVAVVAMAALSCAHSDRNVSAVAMPYQYSDADRLWLNMQTDTEIVKFLRNLKIKQRLELADEDNRKLTYGYYYCAKPENAELKKFREEEVYFVKSLNIKNPFEYLEDQYSDEVKAFVENENLHTYKSLACGSDYKDVLEGLLDQYNTKMFEYDFDNKLKNIYSYEGLAFKHSSYAKSVTGKSIEFVNDELTEEHEAEQKAALEATSKGVSSDTTEVVVQNSAWTNGSNKTDYVARYWKDQKIFAHINYEASEKFAYEIVSLMGLKIEMPLRSDSSEHVKEDVSKALDSEKYKVVMNEWAIRGQIIYTQNGFIFVKVGAGKKLQVVNFYYDKKLKKTLLKTLIALDANQTVGSLLLSDEGVLAVTIKTYDKSEVKFFNADQKLIFSQKFETPFVGIALENSKFVLSEQRRTLAYQDYVFNTETKKLDKVAYATLSDSEVKVETQYYTATKKEKYPYTIAVQKDLEPEFIHLFFYGGFLNESEKSIKALDKYLLSRGGVVVKTFLRGDADLGVGEWLKGRQEGKLDTVQDVINLAKTMQKLYPKLKDKIFIEGWSNGGMVALRAALAEPELFAGVIAGSSNADIIEHYRLSQNDWSAEYGNFDILNVLQKLSPYNQAVTTRKRLPPIFLRAAYDDLNVNPVNSFKMLAALRNNHTGGPFYLMTRPFGSEHGPINYREKLEEYSYIYSFLFKILQGK